VLLLEHEGKGVLREYGIPVPDGVVLSLRDWGEAVAGRIAAPCVVKAQILAGGRGKAGGIRTVEKDDALADEVGALLGAEIKGCLVEQVLVEEKVEAAHERYMGVLVDGAEIVFVMGRQGGVEVESYFGAGKDSFEVVSVDPLRGLFDFQVRGASERLGIPAARWQGYVAVARSLYRIFRECDATLVEINPLAECSDGSLVALDARVVIDDGALFRQPRFAELQSARSGGSELMTRMASLDIQYVPIGGPVGLISSGAGLGVAIMDWVEREGSSISAFIDLDYAVIHGNTDDALKLVLEALDSDPAVRSIIVNFTSCGLRLDQIAGSLVSVMRQRKAQADKPVFIHMQGNRSNLAHEVLREAGLEMYEFLGDAVRYAARAAATVPA
jgi:succinyl-CoA synthetase beta subunit